MRITNDTIFDEWGLLVRNDTRLQSEITSLRYRMGRYNQSPELLNWYKRRISMILVELKDRGAL